MDGKKPALITLQIVNMAIKDFAIRIPIVVPLIILEITPPNYVLIVNILLYLACPATEVTFGDP